MEDFCFTGNVHDDYRIAFALSLMSPDKAAKYRNYLLNKKNKKIYNTMKIEIDIPEGYEVDTENSTKECIKLKKIEKKLPKTWEEFCETHPIKVGERYILFNSSIIGGVPHTFRHPEFDRNNLPSKELAEAMLALCQLIQLRDCYNDGWTPNWTNDKYKYIIFPYKNLLHKCYTFTNNRILAFRTAELRDQFFENFKNLIEIAKPLL